MKEYAEVVPDLMASSLDRTFDYHIPLRLQSRAQVGAPVQIPFGAGGRTVTGFIVALKDSPDIDPDRLKDILDVPAGKLPAESELIALAAWMKERCGGTTAQALRTVLPVRREIRRKEDRTWKSALPREELLETEQALLKKRRTAQARVVRAVLERGSFSSADLKKLKISSENCKTLEEAGVIQCENKEIFRDPYAGEEPKERIPEPNEEQKEAAGRLESLLFSEPGGTAYLYGVTGSGKTLVYMDLIRKAAARGKQSIFLIPEIALSYQTVQRFRAVFGDRASVLHSRMSQGERYDQFDKARQGKLDVIIGPRSALFTPFPDLGLIIMDEEQEESYRSEQTPRYHAREAAAYRAHISGAAFLLGSATPSLDAYAKIQSGAIPCVSLTRRAVPGAVLPKVRVVDMREELKKGNRSVFSDALTEAIEERLSRGEQSLLFLNRRGVANFLSCRSCGEIFKCPHCDVSLTLHDRGRLVCHYCGYETPAPKVCPVCGSSYIASFGTGTQRIEQELKRRFPKARVLRMDTDTTSGKESTDDIIRRFRAREADILVGTQMIVKGHDFPYVTLVCALAADLSLAMPDYTAGEKTFHLLVQAAGRAGRGIRPGEAVIQTYQPENFCIRAAAMQSPELFYPEEAAFRRLMKYPPMQRMEEILISSESEETCVKAADETAAFLKTCIDLLPERDEISLIGPAPPPVARRRDIYYRTIRIKSPRLRPLIWLKDQAEAMARGRKGTVLQFDIR